MAGSSLVNRLTLKTTNVVSSWQGEFILQTTNLASFVDRLNLMDLVVGALDQPVQLVRCRDFMTCDSEVVPRHQ